MLLAVAGVLCSVGTLAAAQDQPVPKWELYGGYSAFYPGCDLHGLLPGGVVPVSSCLTWNPRGVGASITYNFNRWFGLTVDSSGQWGSGETGLVARIDRSEFFNISAGPKMTFRTHYFSPFLEVLVGGHRLRSEVFGSDDAVGFMAGGGLDLNLNRHFALRLFRADFVYSNHQYGPSSIVPATDVRGVRLQSGVVFMFGGGQPGPPVSARCTINPAEVMVGEPATATAAVSSFNPKHTLNYTWSSTGGQITGKDNAASLTTDGVAGGSYTVTAHIVDPKAEKNGMATCSANFTVKETTKNPPTMTCYPSPSTLQAGGSATVACSCTSPDNVPVTVGDWSATGGTINGSGSTATLNTAGASAGVITVSATCTDSRGLKSPPTTTQVTVENPSEVKQLEGRLALHSIYFPTAQPTVANPNGGLLDSQQQTLISLADDFKKYLQTRPDAHLTLEGHADPRASVEYNQALSERRVERTKRFLVEHGVPAVNIETKAFGKQQNLTEAQVKDAVEQNPELTPDERQRVLNNMTTILLASNRRVDIALSTTGQQSLRQYPFNAADSLTLIRQAETKKTAGPAAKKRVTPKVQQ
jgi:outer membrane protein OmpA-like peptidoglycan-associated protein/opacity protein-like surface antigen